jgi:hypothetical protein
MAKPSRNLRELARAIGITCDDACAVVRTFESHETESRGASVILDVLDRSAASAIARYGVRFIPVAERYESTHAVHERALKARQLIEDLEETLTPGIVDNLTANSAIRDSLRLLIRAADRVNNNDDGETLTYVAPTYRLDTSFPEPTPRAHRRTAWPVSK